MLKKIPASELQCGMYLHKLGGSWLSHPFWRSAFVVRDPKDIDAILQHGIDEVWIDTSQGLDVAPAAEPAAAAEVRVPADGPPGPPAASSVAPPRPGEPHPEAAAAPAPPRPASPAQAPRTPFLEEVERARKVCQDSSQAVAAMFQDIRMGRIVDARQALPMVQEIAASVGRNPGALISIARLKTKDDYTYMHSVAVCGLMVALAQQIGMDEREIREAGLAGLVHDLGKAMSPPEVLNKPGALTEEEFAIMKRHPVQGWQALREGAQTSDPVLDVVLHHHEKFDGSGYPHKLVGEGIGHYARMGAICDVYDAVTSARCYKAGWEPGHAVRQMNSWTGHFDRKLLEAFIRSVGIYPIGSLVRLESGRLGVVCEQRGPSLLKPVVNIFHSAATNLPLPAERLDLALPDARDRIVGIENPARWGFGPLDRLWAG
jgi:HD-GYP domain-containing protein (c-di-GMP phosphodiesterase class II)